jgi:hypothetical protein
MSMLQICASPGCGTRTLGQFCIAHEESPFCGQRMRDKATWRSGSTAVRASKPHPPLTTQSRTPVGRPVAM